MGEVAVTGAGGYVGGRLVEHLRSTGAQVRPLARRDVPWMPDARLLDLAVDPAEAIGEAFDGCEAVVHLAGASEVQAARDPDGALASTVAAARRTAAAAAAAGVERFVYLSTVHVYGSSFEDGAHLDEHRVPQPRHSYAVARLAGEHLVAADGPSWLVVLRMTNSVGAPADARVDRWSLVANDLCAQAASGGPLQLRTSGQQWRDFIDLGEACRSIGAAALGEVPTGTYNLGVGHSLSVRELAECVADVAEELAGARPEVLAPPHEGPAPPRVTVDVSRLGEHTPAPSVPLEVSLRELIELCRAATAAGLEIAEG